MPDLKITSHKCSIFLSRHEGSISHMKDIWIDNKLQILYIMNRVNTMKQNHRHLSNTDCLMAHTTCLVCFTSTVNSRSEDKIKEAY
jgi:hypothetical protein